MSEFLPNGTLIGRYRILAPIGQGGMATVYKVTDTVLERDVALKLIRTEQFPPIILETVLKRFEREAKALARLNHPNIVKIHDYGDFGNAPFLVMDFLPGQSFKQIRKPVPYKIAIHLIRPIANALSYAHEQGVFHRDIKPGNIMLTQNGTPVLTDFGIAKLLDTDEGNTLTASGVGIGTPEYMAPEQGFGHEIDGRADQYSLAIVLYELITAHKPFQGNTPMEVVLKQHNESLPPIRDFASDVTASVEIVIRRALAKTPDQRFSDMTSFSDALEDALLSGTSQPIVATQTAAIPQTMMVTEPSSSTETYLSISPIAPFEIPTVSDFLKNKQYARLGAYIRNITNYALKQKVKQLVNEELFNGKIRLTSYRTFGGKCGYINALGEVVIAPQFEAALDFSKGIAPVKKNDQWGYINMQGEIVISPQFDNAWAFSNGLARVRKNWKYGYINKQGIFIIEPQFDNAWDFSDGLARVQKNWKYSFINTNGEIIIKPSVDVAWDFSEKLAKVTKNKQWGYINTHGEIVIAPQFDDAGDFSEGLAIVLKNGMWGYVNPLGKFIIEPKFEFANSFYEGLAMVINDAKINYINTQGEIVIKPLFDNAYDFSEGLAMVKHNSKWGYIDTSGEIVIDFQFNIAKPFYNGIAQVKKNGATYFIDPTGETVFVPF